MNALRKFFGQLNIKSILFYAICVAVTFLVSVTLFFLNLTHTVALEQEVRCGIHEHTHTDSCYRGDFLVCEKTAHTHDGNCYIVLLKENDINGILSMLGNSDDHSLESVITDTVSTALTFNSNLNSADPEEDPDSVSLNQNTVSKLNVTISDQDELPDIVLNENINNIQTLALENGTGSSGKEDGNTMGNLSGNVSTFAVGDDPVNSNYNANFYIYLDGTWTCIGTLPYTTTANGTRYNYTIPTSDVLNLVNSSLGTNYVYNSFSISVSTSENSGYSNSNLSVGSTTTVIAYRQRSTAAKSARYVRLIPAGNNTSATSTAFAFYTVTYEYPDGSTVSIPVRSGTTITLPTGNYEWTSGGKTYAAGEAVTITKKTAFTGVNLGPITYVRINYDVDFPIVSSVTVSTAPTIANLSSTTVTDGYAEGLSAVIRNVSQQSVQGKVQGNSTGLSRVIQFKGWRIENSDVILQPNTTLVWEELLQYATGASINLTAVWEYAAVQTATFFIRFDSVAVDTDGNITGQDSNKYTNELFAAYVGGIDTNLSASQLHNKYHIADTTSDNSYGADQEIRALYGERSEGVWLSAFPTDDYIFSSLVQYAKTGYLSVGGVPVKAEDLNERAYAIRWYVFKAQDDAWHIDGKLVKKEGLIHVYKTFAGNKELVTEAKSDFYIDATDVTAQTNTVLNLRNFTSYNEATDTYLWEITNVDYGELWQITEHPHLFENPDVEFGVYSEFTVMDAHGDQSITGSGTSLTVSGMTYALDEGTDEVLRAEFTNIYNKHDSIVIKKQDALTGVSIGGATFSLLQNGKSLKFSYDSEADKYEYDPVNGDQTVLTGSANGYFEISIEDFSYDLGNITVREMESPTGYSPIGDIEIGYVDDGKDIGIIGGNSEMIKYVSGILIVGNSTDVLSVTAKKTWDCPENEWQPVTVQLLANGKLVTTVIAGVEAQVVLDSENNWQYTWNNLPVYVNGEKIQWSIKEIAVGSEAVKADGSFVNWIASYGIPIQSTDKDGNPHITLTVTNTTKRVMLRLTKTNMEKSILLQGATFFLEAVDGEGNLIPGEVSKTATTGDAGTLIFDNLKCNVRYRITEETAPEGYLEISEYIYFLIHEDGSVTVEDSYYAEQGTTAYNIVVRNAEAIPLPESGGIGIDMFYALGAFLITVSFGIYIYHLLKRRCLN